MGPIRRLIMLVAIGAWFSAPAEGADVDATTLAGKVMCGYQGWFNAPADGAGRGWVHWGRAAMRPGTATVDLWPDVSDLSSAERFPTAYRRADGRAAEVFSSYRADTVRRHFEWMRAYGIDGVFLQRFATELATPAGLRQADRVLDNVRGGARATGRVYGLMYDLSGLTDDNVGRVIDDWRRVVDATRLTADRAYVRDGGRPVVGLWGFGFGDGRDPLVGDGGRRLVRFLRDDPTYGGNRVLVGVPTGWRTLNGDAVADHRLLDLVAGADVVCPWTVGRYATPAAVDRHAAAHWAPDVRWCRQHGKGYMPVVFPGFSWHNLEAVRGRVAPVGQIPRLGGRFLWAQYVAAKRAGATMAFTAMFDEVDEGTAVFKCTNDVPTDDRFLTFDGLPSDFYLRLVGEGTRLIGGRMAAGDERLIK